MAGGAVMSITASWRSRAHRPTGYRDLPAPGSRLDWIEAELAAGPKPNFVPASPIRSWTGHPAEAA
ncbi:hypothetical protein QR77_06040 [Streptomyces sp. 150FB]|nr:hypothetical protein QR77_06040 [Streptomyces sp. 150FB]